LNRRRVRYSFRAAVRTFARLFDIVKTETGCGLGGRVHPQIAWAKLKALSEGAALASKHLWQGRAAA